MNKVGEYSKWESLGGDLSSGISATSWGNNRIDAFAKGNDNELHHIFYNGNSWSKWERLGGNLKDAPGVCSSGPNHIDVFYRCADDTLKYRSWDGI